MRLFQNNRINKISKARAGLVLDQPFFGSLLLRLAPREDPRCQTMYTDGKNLGFNPEWVEELDLPTLKGALCHEVMHLVTMHHTRRGDRDREKWNRACDYAINGIVEEAGFVLPEWRLRDPRYEGMEAERIYSMLPNAASDNPEDANTHNPDGTQGESGSNGKSTTSDQDGNQDQEDNPESKDIKDPSTCPQAGNPNKGRGTGDPGGCGEVRDAVNEDGNSLSGSERLQEEQEWKIAVQQAAQIARRQGSLPSCLERLVQEITEPKIPWREVLSRFLTEVARNDYSWRRPNTRYLHTGIYLPQLRNEELGEVVVIADTSGSVSDDQIMQFAAEVHEILTLHDQEAEISVLYVDSSFQGHDRVSGDDLPHGLTPRGGGGTDYRPGFEWLAEQAIEPVCVVYLTDGRCHRFPENEPDCPVLWTLTEKLSFEPRFGEVVFMS